MSFFNILLSVKNFVFSEEHILPHFVSLSFLIFFLLCLSVCSIKKGYFEKLPCLVEIIHWQRIFFWNINYRTSKHMPSRPHVAHYNLCTAAFAHIKNWQNYNFYQILLILRVKVTFVEFIQVEKCQHSQYFRVEKIVFHIPFEKLRFEILNYIADFEVKTEG